MAKLVHSQNKAALTPLFKAMYDYTPEAVGDAFSSIFHPAATVRLAFPFEDLDGAKELQAKALSPLNYAMPDLERRDSIFIAGAAPNGQNWVGCCGHYTGTFLRPWMDIPPSGHQAAMRFHEFYRVEEGRVVEMQALWDIPELMMQSGAWPLSPSLGREWHVPGPATQDGLVVSGDGAAATKLVSDMLAGLGNFSKGGVEAMQLEKYWHPRFSWYGPAGIGTARGISGFRHWHQIPFLNGMPDRVGSLGKGNLFGEGDYVGFTAWPGLHMTLSDDGWLGIVPSGKKITMRSLDFWRQENGLIRENWVLVDILHVYDQLGVDVFARMRELNKSRYGMPQYID